MQSRNQHIKDFCEDEFTRWYNSRGRYINSRQANVLVQFMPSKSATERDYPNSQLCAAFYLAMMLELDKNINEAMSFLFVYFPSSKPKTFKAFVHQDLHDEVSEKTARLWAHDCAERIYGLAIANVRLNEMLSNQKHTF